MKRFRRCRRIVDGARHGNGPSAILRASSCRPLFFVIFAGVRGDGGQRGHRADRLPDRRQRAGELIFTGIDLQHAMMLAGAIPT
jgi:hypothetical protein